MIGGAEMLDAPMCCLCGERRVSHRGIGQDGYRRWRPQCDRCRRPDNRTARRPDFIARAGGVCQRCGFVASYECQLHIDHIIPIALGGDRNDPGNLQIICANCHAVKTSIEDPVLAKHLRRVGVQLEMNFDVEVQEPLPW